MKKTPSFPLYPDDLIGGTFWMSNAQFGAYVRIFIIQAGAGPQGTVSKDKAVRLCDDGDWDAISEKFIEEGNGELYNQKMRDVLVERDEYRRSRRKNLPKKHPSFTHRLPNAMEPHMGDGDGDGDGDGKEEGDGGGEGGAPKKPKCTKPKPESPKPSESNLLMADGFRQKIVEHKPTARIPATAAGLAKWAEDFRLMQSVDNRTDDEIKEIVEWLFSERSKGGGSFWWADVVLSPSTLRRQWNAGKLDPSSGNKLDLRESIGAYIRGDS